MDEPDNSQTLVLHPNEDEFVLLDYDGDFSKDCEPITLKEFHELQTQRGAITVIVRHNSKLPKRVGA